MLLLLLGVFDLVVSFSIFYPLKQVGFLLVVLMTAKALFSIFSSFAYRYFFDWMGWLDLIAALTLYFSLLGVWHSFFLFVALLLGAKGLWSILSALLKFS